jgi:predicted nucleotidyltransferase
MDFFNLKQLAIQLRRSILDDGIVVDGIVLFGSHAKGNATQNSDIDIAVISRQFGKDRFKEGCFVNKHAYRINPDIEAIPISAKQFLDRQTISPILDEIKKHGVFLL